MQAGDIMTTVVATIAPGEPVSKAATLMAERNIGDLVVVEDEWPVGILTDTDIVYRLVAQGKSSDTQVEEIMSTDLITVASDTPAERLPGIMEKHGFRRLPVIEGKKIVGVVSVTDLIRHREHLGSVMEYLMENELW